MSKEIATLENDMLELKDLLHQWKDLPQLMGMEDTLAPTLDKNGNCMLACPLLSSANLQWNGGGRIGIQLRISLTCTKPSYQTFGLPSKDHKDTSL